MAIASFNFYVHSSIHCVCVCQIGSIEGIFYHRFRIQCYRFIEEIKRQ